MKSVSLKTSPTPEELRSLRCDIDALAVKLVTTTSSLSGAATIEREEALRMQRNLMRLVQDAAELCTYLNRSTL